MKSKLLIIIAIFFSHYSWAAGFDCRNVANRTELMICLDSDLGEMDEILSRNYKNLSDRLNEERRKELRSSQLAWLKSRNELCLTTESCILVYSQRISELKKESSPFLLKESISKYKDMNQLIWDPRFRDLLSSFFGEYKTRMLTLKYDYAHSEVEQVLGGPPNDLDRKGNLVIGSACRAHSCPEKGYIVYDIETGDLLVGVVHYINKDAEITNDPIFSIFYKNETFLNENEEILKSSVNKEIKFSNVNKIQLK